MITEETIQEIIEYLQGSCKSIDEVCNIFEIDSEELNSDHLEKIHSELFKCTSCGWWCEVAESSEDSPDEENYCISCANEEIETEEDY